MFSEDRFRVLPSCHHWKPKKVRCTCPEGAREPLIFGGFFNIKRCEKNWSRAREEISEGPNSCPIVQWDPAMAVSETLERLTLEDEGLSAGRGRLWLWEGYWFLVFFFGFLLICWIPVALLFCWSCSCTPASVLFCFSVFLPFAFPASLLFCFFASLLVLCLCFSCFSAFPAFLLFAFPASLLFLLLFFSAIVLLCLSTYTILLFLFFSHVFLLLHFLLLCFFTSCLYCLSLFFNFLLLSSFLFVS